jgi:hypothetical protein
VLASERAYGWLFVPPSPQSIERSIVVVYKIDFERLGITAAIIGGFFAAGFVLPTGRSRERESEKVIPGEVKPGPATSEGTADLA